MPLWHSPTQITARTQTRKLRFIPQLRGISPIIHFPLPRSGTTTRKINTDTLKNNGLWYSFDVTKSVKEAYTEDKELNVALWIPWEANTDYSEYL